MATARHSKLSSNNWIYDHDLFAAKHDLLGDGRSALLCLYLQVELSSTVGGETDNSELESDLKHVDSLNLDGQKK